VCELSITIGGTGQSGLLDKLVDEAIESASSADEGARTWSSLVEQREFRFGQFGNAQLKTPDERRHAVMRYDWNRDARVDRDEMRRLLTRNQRSGGSLVVRSNDASLGDTAAATPAWQLIDTNGDQELSADELRAAPQRLLTRDERDDELVVDSELAPSTEPSETDRSMNMPAQPLLALSLWAETDWKRLLGTFHATYPRLRTSSATGTRRAAELFDRLDSNASGTLSAEELASLQTCEPHLKIVAQFGAGDDNPDPPLSVKPLAMATTWTSIATDANAGRVSLDTEGLTLVWSLTRAPNETEYADKTAQSQFTAYDRDANGYLDRTEVGPAEQALGAFDSLDLNGDDKVYPDELATYLARQQVASGALFQAIVGRAADAVFVALDVDRDSRLGAREIAGATARLATLDANADGRLTPDEIPDRMTVDIARGARPSDAMQMYSVASPVAIVVRRGPTWFQRMDANGDGDVSPREFLGSRERFAELDSDRDGFIDAHEAQKLSDERGQGRNAHMEPPAE
jgi:Ca2+-binding EF-hand superfamily protein